MRTIGVSEAKAHFSSLFNTVSRGEMITITEHGVLIAQLIPPPSERGHHTAAVIQALREFRQSVTLGDVPLRGSLEEGRR